MSMKTFNNVFDTSNYSIGLAVFMFIFAFVLSKYMIESYSEENNEWMVILYSFLVGTATSLLSMASFRICINYASPDILTDPFYSTRQFGQKLCLQ